MRTLWKVFAGCAASLTAGVTFALPTWGQSAADLRASYASAFQETLSKPRDAQILLKYARLATEVGDYEGAISAYERFLLIDADQPRVKFELGLLYYRLKSWEAARVYFEGARDSARTTPEIRARSAEYIADIASRSGTSRFTGELLAGLRFSDNANTASAGVIRSLGSTIVPNSTFSQRPDFAAVAAANLHHRYDFGRQDSGTLESDLALYSSRQFQVSEANVTLVDLAIGPRSQPFDGALREVTLKPFFTGRYLAVHDLTTYWSWGAGMETTAPVGDKIRATFALQGRHREYIDNNDVFDNNLNSGNEGGAILELRAQLAPNIVLRIGGDYTRYVAQTASENYVEAGFGGILTVHFDDPVGINGRKWFVTGNAGLHFASYDQPDPTVDPSTRRSQTDLNLGLLLGIPLDDRLVLVGQVGYLQRSASINNYAFNAFSSLIGMSWHF